MLAGLLVAAFGNPNNVLFPLTILVAHLIGLASLDDGSRQLS